MSKDIGLIKCAGSDCRDIAVTAFYGGSDAGQCFQLTQENEGRHVYVTLRAEDVIALTHIIGNHLAGDD